MLGYSHARRGRRRLRVGWLLILLVGMGISGASAMGAGSSRATPDAPLLKEYQPVLVFHPSELFRPTKVQSFVADSELERFVGTNPTQLPYDAYWTVADPDPDPGELPPVTPGVVYRLDQVGCDADGTLGGRDCYAAAWGTGSGGDAVYGRVVRTPSYVVLQYWLFYYDNPLILPPITIPGVGQASFWQSHEGDWELVNVILAPDESPVQAAYSQHCSGQRKAWEAVTKWPSGSTHPVVYVALGSHANYFAPGPAPAGAIPIAATCIPSFVPGSLKPLIVDQVVDGSSEGAILGPTGVGVNPATIHPIEDTSWATFGGRWGESEYFFTSIPIPANPPFPAVPAGTAVPVGLAPASPANQATWNPAVVLGWPAP